MKKKTAHEKSRGLYFGRVSFSGIGGYQEKMISELLESGVVLRRVMTAGGTVSGEISPLDYYTAAKAARRNGVRIRAGKRRGLYFTLMRYKMRFGLYVGGLMLMIMLSMFQTRVEAINIEGDVPRGQILEILRQNGIEKGADKYSLQMSRAEHQIMLEVENCSWVDVSCVGFRVNVRVEKGTPLPEMEEDQPRNIVASRGAMIISQTVREGASEVAVGSGVAEGTLLVSGVVPDGNDDVLFVRADAEIIGEFTETQEFYVPFSETVRRADGDKTEFSYIVFNDDEYPMFFGEANVPDAVYSEETKLVRIFDAEMPFKIKTGTYTAYRYVEVIRSAEDCTRELKRLKDDYEQNFYSEYEVAAAEEKYYPDEGGVKLVVDYTLRGDIAKPVVIEMGAAGE